MQKDAQKGDFWNSLDPFLGFILKTVPGIHDPCISGLPFGTKNHEMRGPPVMPSPSASSKFVLSVLKFLGILKFLSYTQNILGVLKWANLCSKI